MLNVTLGVQTPQGRDLVASFSMTIHRHDKIALIGEEGNGKSMFLKVLREDPSIQDLIIERKISHPQTVFASFMQEIADKDVSVRDFIIEEDWDRYTQFDRMLARHLPNFTDMDLERPMKSLSGGEKVKVQLIRLSLIEADVLLLDEPSNDLDLETLEWLENWMLEEERPILFVSHDVMLLEHVANRIVHLEQTHRKTRSKVTLFEGKYQDYVSNRNRMITTHNDNVDNARQEKAKKLERWQQIQQRVEHEQNVITRQNAHGGQLLKKKMKQVTSMKKRFDRDVIEDKIDQEESIALRFEKPSSKGSNATRLIDIPELKIGDRILGHNYKLQIQAKDKIAIVGKNGSGKTTFLTEAFKDEAAFMHQDYEKNLDYSLNAVDNCIHTGSSEERGMITNYLGSLKFTPNEMNQAVGTLSGGQKAKIALLKLVLAKPRFLVLDEPTRNLSPLSVGVIYTLLRDFDGAIVCISHDRKFLEAVFDYVYEFTETGLTLKE